MAIFSNGLFYKLKKLHWESIALLSSRDSSFWEIAHDLGEFTGELTRKILLMFGSKEMRSENPEILKLLEIIIASYSAQFLCRNPEIDCPNEGEKLANFLEISDLKGSFLEYFHQKYHQFYGYLLGSR